MCPLWKDWESSFCQSCFLKLYFSSKFRLDEHTLRLPKTYRLGQFCRPGWGGGTDYAHLIGLSPKNMFCLPLVVTPNQCVQKWLHYSWTYVVLELVVGSENSSSEFYNILDHRKINISALQNLGSFISLTKLFSFLKCFLQFQKKFHTTFRKSQSLARTSSSFQNLYSIFKTFK